MTDIAIHVEGLSKRYRIGRAQEQHDTLRDAAAAWLRRPLEHLRGDGRGGGHEDSTIWALKDVSFEVERGEVLGIIGPNGAGKSTLLKILCRITQPTEGKAVIDGRVGSLLEVGTGFHPELTGRDNIYLNAAILGMPRSVIDRKFDEIVAFSGVERFIDTPVKRYSSGMYVRLAFAVAAHLEPEILLIDEVLSVGDTEFQQKCLGKMGDVAQEGRTVVFVSHNMGAVSALCSETLYLERGTVQDRGRTKRIVADYLSQAVRPSVANLDDLRSPRFGRTIRFTEVQLVSSEDRKVPYGDPLKYRLRIQSCISATNLSIGSSIFNAAGSVIGSLVTTPEFALEAGQTVTLELTIADTRLAPGIYYCGFSIGRGGLDSGRQDYDIVVGSPLTFQVIPPLEGDVSLDGWSPGWGDIVFGDNSLRMLGGHKSNRERAE